MPRNGNAHLRGYAIFRVPQGWVEKRFDFSNPSAIRDGPVAGLSADVDLVLLDFGVASLVGIGVVGHIVDRYLRGAVLLSLASFALVALLLGWGSDSVAVIYLSVFVWGLTFGGAATLLQTALADMAGPGADAAMAMNVVTWNGAIAGGGVLGGLLL